MGIEKIFSLPASVFSFISGILIGLSINILSDLLFLQYSTTGIKEIFIRVAILVILLFLISSITFMYLSIVVAENRERLSLYDFLEKIRKDTFLRANLLLSLLLGIVCIILAIISLLLAFKFV
ncbi:MAG: hypothetical protein B5M53_02585 [Candidatus Cloacimonas sp. 4484_209]|nr:MAG: hypothetical protein B5M53_02585 [Candidatus Cloacimonas sp. 4484_209]